jgi:hypothetical protein
MDDSLSRSFLSLKVIYFDEHLIEVECEMVVAKWSAVAQAYTSKEDIQDFARRVHEFGMTLAGPLDWTIGPPTNDLIFIRLFTADRAGHVHCRASLAKDKWAADEIWRFTADIPTEAADILRFAQQLNRLSETLTGKAILESH